MALAVWLLGDEIMLRKGIKFTANSFTLNEVKLLSKVLTEKYNLKTSIVKIGVVNQYNIYITKSSFCAGYTRRDKTLYIWNKVI